MTSILALDGVLLLLLTAQWVRCLQAVAYFVIWLLSVADIERAHGRSKRTFSKHGSQFIGIATKSFGDQLREHAFLGARRVDELLRRFKSGREPPPVLGLEPPKKMRRSSGYDAYKEEKKLQARAAGLSTQKLTFTKAGHATLNAGWHALHKDETAKYNLIADKPLDTTSRAMAPSTAIVPSTSTSTLSLRGDVPQLSLAELRVSLPTFLPHAKPDLMSGLQPCDDKDLEFQNAVTALSAVASLKDAETTQVHTKSYLIAYDQIHATSKDEVEATFRERISQLVTDTSAVPDEPVPQPDLCGYSCRTDEIDSNTKKLQLRDLLVKTMEKFVQERCRTLKCKPVQLTFKQYMFVYETMDENGEGSDLLVCQVTLAKLRGGILRAFCGYIEFYVVGLSEETASNWWDAKPIVAPKQDSFVPTQLEHIEFLDPGGTGPYLCLTDRELADKVLSILDVEMDNMAEDANMKKRGIRVTLVSHEAFRGAWATLGVTEDFVFLHVYFCRTWCSRPVFGLILGFFLPFDVHRTFSNRAPYTICSF